MRPIVSASLVKIFFKLVLAIIGVFILQNKSL
jgi:hypothetical protein